MYKCDHCGRIIRKKNSLQGYTLCSKYMHQLYQYGKFLDNIQRTTKDLNDYIIENDVVKVHCYNQHNEYINDFIIDLNCLEKIKNYKWCLSQNYPIIGSGKKQHIITHILLDVKDNQVVDHINGNTLDNCLENLRICAQSENVLNKAKINSATSFMGVTEDKRRKYKRFCLEIHYKYQKIFLGNYSEISYAVYARYIAEIILFKQFRNTNDDHIKFTVIDTILIVKRFDIIQYILMKICKKLNIKL